MRDPCRLLLLLLVTAGAEVHTVQFATKFSGQALARKQQHEIALSSLNRGIQQINLCRDTTGLALLVIIYQSPTEPGQSNENLCWLGRNTVDDINPA